MNAQVELVETIGTCSRCGCIGALYPSPSPVYALVCQPCGNGDNAGMVTR